MKIKIRNRERIFEPEASMDLTHRMLPGSIFNRNIFRSIV